jgi:hypothetical protein
MNKPEISLERPSWITPLWRYHTLLKLYRSAIDLLVVQNQLRKTEEGKQQLIQAMGVRSVDVIHSSVYNRRWLASCYHEACTVVAHHICINSDNLIFKRGEFQGLTCFQIAHHPVMRGSWNCKKSRKGTIVVEMGDQKRKPRVREVNASHKMFLSLRNDYGLGSITRKRSRAWYCWDCLEHLNLCFC